MTAIVVNYLVVTVHSPKSEVLAMEVMMTMTIKR